MPWWIWTLGVVGALGIGSAIAFRAQIQFAMKLAKALATDSRLPRALRWAIGVALAMKVVPFPDFGIDEAILLVVGLLLATVYRPTFILIVAQVRRDQSELEAIDAVSTPKERP